MCHKDNYSVCVSETTKKTLFWRHLIKKLTKNKITECILSSSTTLNSEKNKRILNSKLRIQLSKKQLNKTNCKSRNTQTQREKRRKYENVKWVSLMNLPPLSHTSCHTRLDLRFGIRVIQRSRDIFFTFKYHFLLSTSKVMEYSYCKYINSSRGK